LWGAEELRENAVVFTAGWQLRHERRVKSERPGEKAVFSTAGWQTSEQRRKSESPLKTLFAPRRVGKPAKSDG
jgi:hypothetical protein